MALLRARRAGPSRGAIAAVSASGIAAGAALFYFLDPRRGGERRQRTGQALREAGARAGANARDLGRSAAHTLREARSQAERRMREATEHAKGAAEEVQASAAEGREALGRRGLSDDQAIQGVSGGVLLARAIFGRGLMRIPAGFLGVSSFARLASRSDTLHRGVRRMRDAARSTADLLRREGAPSGSRSGGGHLDVREVKSPAELEPGIASGSPEPTYPNRADRSGPHMRDPGEGGGGAYDAAGAGGTAEVGEDGGFILPSTDDVARAVDFDAPEPGRAVREDDLGMVMPPERAREPEDEAVPRILAPADASATPSPRIFGPDDRPIEHEPSLDEPAPRITGAGDAARRDPTRDGE